MAIFGLTEHKVVEVGKLHGLLSGHMVAQSAYNVGAGNYLDNGFILSLQADGTLAKFEDAPGTGAFIAADIFLHYTEELLTGPVSGLKYFTVDAEADGLCYPRAIALYVGDEFNTDNFAGTLPAAEAVGTAVVVDGVLTVGAAVAGKPLFTVKRDYLPDGTLAGSFMLITKAYAVA